MNDLVTIALVMLAAGFLGGIVNAFLSDPEEEKPMAWWQHITLGVTASFMVPVFLNMISSDLIDQIRGVGKTTADYSKLFVLAGFCLIAAVSSRAFIRNLSERILQQVKSANRKAEQAKADAADAMAATAPLIEAESEPGDSSAALAAPNGPVPTADELRVWQAIKNSSYSLRTLSGIAKDSGMPKEAVNGSLSTLMAKGLVHQTLSSKGQLRWYASPEGAQKNSPDADAASGGP